MIGMRVISLPLLLLLCLLHEGGCAMRRGSANRASSNSNSRGSSSDSDSTSSSISSSVGGRDAKPLRGRTTTSGGATTNRAASAYARSPLQVGCVEGTQMYVPTTTSDSRRSTAKRGENNETTGAISTTRSTGPTMTAIDLVPTSIAFEPYRGSVTHYYHFVFGALIPFIEYHTTTTTTTSARGSGKSKGMSLNGGKYTIASDLGPMKRLMHELPLVFEEAVDKEVKSMLFDRINFNNSRMAYHRLPQRMSCITHATLASRNATNRKQGYVNTVPSVFVLPSYDIHYEELFRVYKRMLVTPETRRRVLAYLDSTMPPYVLELPTYDIVLVQRHFDPTYTADAPGGSNKVKFNLIRRAKAATGDLRRNISNHAELHAALRDRVKEMGKYTFKNIIFDRFGLYYQYHLFRSARVVVAQHGAVLGNIFFMRGINDVITNGASSTSTSSSTSVGVIDSSSGTTVSGRKMAATASTRRFPSCVLEISPPYSRDHYIFRNLAAATGVGHLLIEQETQLGDVNVTAVLETFEIARNKCF